MSNLPIKQTKLNIFEKIKLRFYQLRKYGKWYESAPEYIKQDEKIIKKMIKPVLQSKGFIGFKGEKNFIIEIFKNNPELFDNEDRKKIVEIVKRESHDENTMACIANLTIEEQCEIVDDLGEYTVYPFISLETVKYLIDNGKFVEEFFERCTSDIQVNIMEGNKEFISEGSSEAQNRYLKDNPDDFELASIYGKIEFLSKNTEYLSQYPEYVKEMPKEIQRKFASLKRENLIYIEEELQIKIVQDRSKDSKLNAFLYANKKVKDKILFDEKNSEILKELIYRDYKNIKYIKKRDYEKYFDCKKKYLTSIKDDIKEYDSEKIKDIFIKGGMLFAKGNLRTSEGSWQGNVFEHSNDIYTKQEVDIIQLLNPKQMAKLIEVDSNYILPCVIETGWDKRIREDVKDDYKEKCKAIFLELYGKEKLEEYDECIDEIFQKAIEFENIPYENYKIKQSRSPLESLKLLFNRKIMENNSPELIKKYYSKLLNEKIEENGKSIVLDDNSANEDLKQIILNTYGKDAVDIMDSRKELDIYTINSLEVFDERILNNFDKEFIHDLLSYNIDDFSAFLNIIKNENELKLFKEYYDLLSQSMGKNVEVIQKAISEFYYVADLLKDIGDKQLTEKQKLNLMSCICGENNQYNIENLEQLDNYIEISNKQFEFELSECEKNISNENKEQRLEKIKECIFLNVFGIKYKRDFKDENVSYGDTIDSIMNLYEINTDELELTEEEKDILNCINFIYNEKSIEKLLELAKLLKEKEEIKNPIALYSIIQKVKENGIEVLNKTLLTKEELDKMCEDPKNEGTIKKEINVGVEIYYFDGVQLPKNKCLLIHNNYNSYGRNIMESESQLGMSTISTYYASQPIKDIIDTGSNYIYTGVEAEDLLGSFVTNEYGDADTSHVPKVVKASAHKINIRETIGTRGKILPEISFYRRTRNHNKRNKEKMDGRIKPSFICVINHSGDSTLSIEDISKYKLDEAKKYGIPIIVINKCRYVSKERNSYER